MKIVITDASTVTTGDLDLSVLKELGELIVYDLTEPEELAERLKDADIVLLNKTEIREKDMAQAPNLKMIGLFATGYNNIDVAYANAHGITVCNVPGYSTEAVAQHTFAFLLALINRVGEYNAMVEEGDWVRSRTFTFFPLPLRELSGKTLGIVGYGAIGRRVSEIARAFGMHVLAVNRHAINDTSVEQVPFDEMLSRADVVSLHCPLNDDSRGMIDRAALAKMKDGAFLINTARGALVNEQDLADALESGKLAGAGVDVLTREPMTPDCPLLHAPHCLITPHVAWAGYETRVRLLGEVMNNVRCFLSGHPVNVVK